MQGTRVVGEGRRMLLPQRPVVFQIVSSFPGPGAPWAIPAGSTPASRAQSHAQVLDAAIPVSPSPRGVVGDTYKAGL